MFRQRKKVVIDGKDRGKTVVVDSETDEVEQEHELLSSTQKGKLWKTMSQKTQNPYEKIQQIP